jgi:hypothetical protein
MGNKKKFEELSSHLLKVPEKAFLTSFSKLVDIIASFLSFLEKKFRDKSLKDKKKNKREEETRRKKDKSNNTNDFLDVVKFSGIIYGAISSAIFKMIGWRRIFLIPVEILVIFLIATAVAVKISYDLGFNPKDENEKMFILECVLNSMNMKKIMKEKFFLDNLTANKKIIENIYDEIEKKYKERVEKMRRKFKTQKI